MVEGGRFMDTMKAIYKILETLEKSLDEEDFDFNQIRPEAIGISEYKWHRIIGIMMNEGFIDGFMEIQTLGMRFPQYKIVSPTITFKGLVYLAENSNIAKIINAAKLIKDIVPFT